MAGRLVTESFRLGPSRRRRSQPPEVQARPALPTRRKEISTVDKCHPMAHGLGAIMEACRRPLRQHYAVTRRMEGRMCEDAIVPTLGRARKPSGSAEVFWKNFATHGGGGATGERAGSAGET
jgi:hypothetical protein